MALLSSTVSLGRTCIFSGEIPDVDPSCFVSCVCTFVIFPICTLMSAASNGGSPLPITRKSMQVEIIFLVSVSDKLSIALRLRLKTEK